MIKKIIVSFGLLISLVSNAQEGTSSPYSFYGIGDVKFKGTVETRSMGGVSVFSDSIHINLQNPAQLAGLKLTTFAVGGSTSNTKLNTETQNEKARRTNLDYLAVGIPAGKFGFTFGLMPYSSVGYKILNLADENNLYSTQYNGIGGINKVFLGLGYKINKNLSVGLDAQYNFGTIETKSFRYLTTIESGTLEENVSRIQGINFTTGLAYEKKLNNKYTYFGSLVYAPQANLKLKNERTITVSDQVDNQPVQNLNFNLPSRLSIGSGFGEVRKWLVGAEVTLQSSSNLKNRFDDINGVVFENSTRYSVGGYYIPNYSSYSSFFKRVTYRGGLRYENTGMVIQNKSIEDFAVNLGLGLPLSGTFSNLNIGFEVGKRGTKYYNLIEENYINLSIGLSFSDRWFVKRKYN
ncbi:MAG TPA: hypothetical protein PK218_00885 [Flavobacterium sp.]|jgi:hypothetical protein|uniref:hypothetical protein n=1 Tax=Flavobacterium sp. TaxID=239 RepID=UPI002CF0DA77|nr:hypothetical protein [Flavobacterium sp.]MCA0349998.1 hypothetical protein [Bacteroidota bacterium]HPW97096.1 hypothetical protein [Flavobacterium sp.]HQA73559.1 hypothetical protein [Flavobacterium sp.]